MYYYSSQYHVTATMASYTSLPEPLLSQELARQARPKSFSDTDCVSFQPCPLPSAANQDRYIVEDWPLHTGTWAFRAVFDGKKLPLPMPGASSAHPDLSRTRWP